MPNYPKVPLPPWDYDIQTFARFYAEGWNNWVDGDEDSDPRRFENFVKFARAVGKDTTDLSLLGAPAWLPAPPPPMPDIPAPLPPAIPGKIQTRYGPVTEPANSAIQQAWPEELWVDAAELCKLESGWNPFAENNTLYIGPCGTPYTLPDGRRAVTEKSIGLFQINVCVRPDDPRYTEALFNAQKGYSLYQNGGWAHWLYSAQALGLL